MQKRILAIHDISCVGRCSLTVALPILSAAGLETSVLPTAVLSTHTGGFGDFTYRDLTDDIAPISAHWQSLGLQFDALYSGFLGSFAQIDLVAELFRTHKKESGLVLVDPVMADHGKLYTIYSPEMVQGMAKLCAQADIITPNLTEAAFLLGVPYVGAGYSQAYIEDMLRQLAKLGAKQVVLTGVSFAPDQTGAACYDATTDCITYVHGARIAGDYHGTGDIFGSALLAACMLDFNLTQSAQIAVNYTFAAIQKGVANGGDRRYGVAFEQAIPTLLHELQLI